MASGLAIAIGYCSIRQSLGRLDLHYGMKAASSGNIGSALVLFHRSAGQWKTADAVGGEGICLLWMNQTNLGLHLIEQAATMRRSESKFEDYYEGLYFFYHNQWETAIPLLESASTDDIYRWKVTELIAVIELEKGDPKNAENLMRPYAGAPVADYIEAYILASLDISNGKRAEAKGMGEKYASQNVPPFWKSRFDKLDAELQNPAR
jgi:hypothetical protein